MTPDERAALNSVVRRFEPLCTPGESDIAIWRAAKAFWLERAAKRCDNFASVRVNEAQWAATKLAEIIRALSKEE
jgi:hypothetical protein